MLKRHSACTCGWIGQLVVYAAILLTPAAALAQTALEISLGGRWSGTAAPFALAAEEGYFEAEGISVTIEPAANSLQSITRVASGEADVAIADLGTLIRYRHDNPEAEPKAVMMIEDRAPHAIVGRMSRGITTDLASLHGKTLGAPEAADAYGLWPVLKAVAGIDDSGMKFENVGLAVREPMLAQGDLDAVFGPATLSYIDLKARGVPEDDIVVMPMRSYGLDVYGSAVIVSEQFAQEKPDAVKGLLLAISRAFRETVRDPESAIEPVLERAGTSEEEVELERLRMSLEQNILTPWVRQNGIGGVDEQRLDIMLDLIGQAVGEKDLIEASDVFTSAFLPPIELRQMPLAP